MYYSTLKGQVLISEALYDGAVVNVFFSYLIPFIFTETSFDDCSNWQRSTA